MVKNMKINIQDRDLKILSGLYRYGVLSTNQIANLFFLNISHTTTMKRLRKIKHANFIREAHVRQNGERVWTLAKEGFSVLKKEVLFKYTNKNTIEHDVLLSECRIILDELGLGKNWISDKDEKFKNAEIIPDGLFIAEVLGRPTAVAFELELHIKAHSRYQNLFRTYSFRHSIGFIWYVVANKNVAKVVLNNWLKVNERYKLPQLLITSLDNLLKDKDLAQIIFSNGEKKSVKDFFLAQETTHGVSSLEESELSNSRNNNSENKHGFKKTPEPKGRVPSSLDHSPSTCVYIESGRRLQAQEGSGVRNEIEGGN